MTLLSAIRRARAAVRLGALAVAVPGCICAQSQPTASMAPVILDRVVAVVNHHVILASDLDDAIRLSVLDPNPGGQAELTPQHALEELISRTLIEQQIRQEDAEAVMPSQAEVDARIAELRKELPACVHEHCATEAGWKAFLAAHGLTEQQAVAYLRYRMEILNFIEQRFRPGIRIEPEQIAKYYHDTLLPQYRSGEAIPPLAQVAPRIEEILLEEQVNVLFDDWLANLRKEGDVEVLDPSLETAANKPAAESGNNE